MVPSFYRSSKCSGEIFSVHLVARFIVGRQFDITCACSEWHMPHTSITTPIESNRHIFFLGIRLCTSYVP